jgi:outer membrane lipoprotein-sorting protein
MTSYSSKSTNVISMNGQGMQQKIEVNMTTTTDSSGKMRIEATGVTAMLMIYDGNTFWMYFSQLNKYAKVSTGAGVQGSGGAVPGMPGMSGDTFGPYKNVAANVKDATILRAEKLSFGGSDVDCWVVTVDYQPHIGAASSAQPAGASAANGTVTKTLWIDKTHYLVYQEDSTSKATLPGAPGPMESKQTVKYESIVRDPPIGPDTFKFSPPEGATEMDLSSFMPHPPAAK